MAKTVVPNTSKTNYTPTHEEIAAHAYQIYLRNGCVEGRDLDHWLQAEKELHALANGNSNGQTTAPSTERTAGASRPKQENVLANSVVPPTAPIAQITGSTTPRKSTRREAAAAAK